MNNTTILTSMDNTSELRDMILNNPNLPLIIFAGEGAWNEEFAYSMAEVTSVEIKEMTVYKNYYMERKEYKEKLVDNLSDKEEYKNLSNLEYFNMIDKKVEETDFVKAIVIYVG